MAGHRDSGLADTVLMFMQPVTGGMNDADADYGVPWWQLWLVAEEISCFGY